MQGGPGGGGPEASNILVDRFLANDEWQAMYDDTLDILRASLYESGAASGILDTWSDLLMADAADLVDAAVVTAEADSIAAYFS